MTDEEFFQAVKDSQEGRRPMSFPQWLEETAMPMERFSRKADISLVTVRRLREGRHAASPRIVRAVAEVVDDRVNLFELLMGKKGMKEYERSQKKQGISGNNERVISYSIGKRSYKMPSPEQVAELEKKWSRFLEGVRDPYARSVMAVMYERTYQEAEAELGPA